MAAGAEEVRSLNALGVRGIFKLSTPAEECIGNMSARSHSPRELRRRVVLPARLRTGGKWSTATILNLSSRGLMIHSARVGDEGGTVEICRGNHLILASVMWRDGARLGLRAAEQLPVAEILCGSDAQVLQLVGSPCAAGKQRQVKRPAADARDRGMAMQFLAISLVSLALALSAWFITQRALSRPFATIERALGRDLSLPERLQ